MSSPRRAPDTTVRRLSQYYRALQQVLAEGGRKVASEQLAEIVGSTSAQVRKDLGYFGNFGVRGRGYDVAHLRRQIGALLGLDRKWTAVLVGAGRLGSALASYGGFGGQGFEIVAIFDADPSKVATVVEGRPVREVATLREFLRADPVPIGIITTPPEVAQGVAEIMAECGVRGILNFAPATLVVGPEVSVRHVDLALELEGLSFAITEATNGTGEDAEDRDPGNFAGIEEA
jgi:redox-sensing transcriptional repressor